MKKTILIYGLCGGALIVLLRLVEYRFLVVEHSIEIYGGLVAALFAVWVSGWASSLLASKKSLSSARSRYPRNRSCSTKTAGVNSASRPRELEIRFRGLLLRIRLKAVETA